MFIFRSKITNLQSKIPKITIFISENIDFRVTFDLISHFRIFYFDSKMIIFESKLKFTEIKNDIIPIEI